MSLFRITFTFVLLFILMTCTSAGSLRRDRRYRRKLCRKLSVPMCSDGKVNYDFTAASTPNDFVANLYWPMINIGCSEYIRLFLCSFAYPSCLPQDGTTLPPCRSLCVQVMQKCQPLMAREFTMSWPEDLRCWQFPNDNCMDANGPVLSPPPGRCSKNIGIEESAGARFTNQFESSRVDVVLDSANAIIEESSPQWADMSLDFRTTSATTQVIFVASRYSTRKGRSYENSVVAFLDNGFLGCNVRCGIVRSDVMDNVRVPLNDGKWHKISFDTRQGTLVVDNSIPAVQCYGGASDCRDFGEVTIGNWMRGVSPVHRRKTGDLSEARFDGCIRNLRLSRLNQILPIVTRYNLVSNCCS
ncbi:frizzled-4-like isoform X2 [Lineus longissimus]|uniref:frizzled-4-like isoform X2 n=1 Tax=Lineus longissimus TaxID=88925 RepID=UPI00315D65D4